MIKYLMKCDISNIKFNEKYRVKSARHPNHDYSSNGVYFITICTLNKNKFFGKIIDNKMKLSKKGKIAENHWKEISKHYSQIYLDDFVIMPNHIHGLIKIKNVETTNLGVSNIDTNLLNNKNLIGLEKWKISLIVKIINQFKRTTTIEMKNKNLFFGWQSRFFDEIIKDEKHYWTIKNYIKNNPKNWEKDDCFI